MTTKIDTGTPLEKIKFNTVDGESYLLTGNSFDIHEIIDERFIEVNDGNRIIYILISAVVSIEYLGKE